MIKCIQYWSRVTFIPMYITTRLYIPAIRQTMYTTIPVLVNLPYMARLLGILNDSQQWFEGVFDVN